MPKKHIPGNGSTHARIVIATTSWKKAAESVGESLFAARTYGSITHNEREIAWCTQPEHVGIPYYVPTNERYSPNCNFYPVPK